MKDNEANNAKYNPEQFPKQWPNKNVTFYESAQDVQPSSVLQKAHELETLINDVRKSLTD